MSIVVLAPQSAVAMYRPGPDTDLSPRLAELAKPAVRAMPPAEQARHLGVAAEGPGSLMREGGRVIVNARFSHGAIAALGQLREAGAKVLAPSRRYQSVTLAIAPRRLHELSAVPGLAGVVEQRAPLLFGAGAVPAAVGATCEGGSILSEGVSQLQVAQARSKYGLDGSGVTVGVLSDSYDEATKAASGEEPVATHAGEDVETGDLPGPVNPCAGEETEVNVLEDEPPSTPFFDPTDEGRAMLQIVHDVAPGAGLAFATAFVSELSFAENIERLARPVGEEGAGADVIVDDVVWFEEPFFQDGPIAVAANKVVAKGIPYFSAAGNDNLFEGEHEIASWETSEFRGAGSCPSAVLKFAELASGNCLDFNPGAGKDTTFGITVSAEETLTVDLQWAQPWYGVKTDFDAYLLDSKSENVLMAEDNNNIEEKLQKPAEVLQWENTSKTARTVQFVVNRCTGVVCNPESEANTPTVKLALLQNGGGVTKTEYPESSLPTDIVGPTIFGHAGSGETSAVAAVPYSNSTTVERYSSRGPWSIALAR